MYPPPRAQLSAIPPLSGTKKALGDAGIKGFDTFGGPVVQE
jgi:hypothetical protein